MKKGIKGTKAYLKYLLGKFGWMDVPRYYLKIFKDDTFIVSYPRSGNTWIRFLIGNLLNDCKIIFSNMEQYVPDIYKNSNYQLLKINRPRIIKSHEPLNFLSRNYPKVIYLVRDPRDVVISYYFWELKFNNLKTSIDEYIMRFIYGINSNYGKWSDHVINWYNYQDKIINGFLFVKYEELKQNTENELKRISDFLGYVIGNDKMKSAIERSSFSSMKKIENEDKNAELFKGSDTKISFIRSGGKDWPNFFSNTIKEEFAKEFNPLMKKLGYIKTDNW